MQQTLSENGFEKFRKKTRKEQFPEEMEILILWKELAEAIKPFYPPSKGSEAYPDRHRTHVANPFSPALV